MKTPRAILITGASSGLGAALARTYAARDVKLALLGRDAARLAAVAKDCEAAGATVATTTIDVTDHSALSRWIERIDDDWAIDLVIANAGITGGLGAERWREAHAAVERVLSVNLHGVLNTIDLPLDRMKARGRGQIALMSSLAGLRGLPYSPTYSATKAALIAYGESLRGPLAQHGIAVNVICPGFIDTPLDDSISGPKPFRLSAPRAAAIIRRGLRRNKARIGFPLLLYWGTLLLRIAPPWLADWGLGRVAVDVPEPVLPQKKSGKRR